MYDLDGDDKISREELLAVLHMMVGANISEEQVRIFYHLDNYVYKYKVISQLAPNKIYMLSSPVTVTKSAVMMLKG